MLCCMLLLHHSLDRLAASDETVCLSSSHWSHYVCLYHMQVGGGFGPSDAAKMVTNSKKVLPGIITGMVWDYRSIKLGACHTIPRGVVFKQGMV